MDSAKSIGRSAYAYDRGGKFALYRQLPSLRHYPLIAQDRVAVDGQRSGIDKAASSARNRSSGVGGQPGTLTSTGNTWSTPPRQA